MSPTHYIGHEFEALKLRYEDQVALLRSLTELDFKIFTAFFTLQLFVGSFISVQAASSRGSQAGLAGIDIVLAVLSIKLLYNNHLRRKEVAATIANLNEALGFNAVGAYLDGKPLNPKYDRRYWFTWYAVGVLLSTLGVLVVLFGR
jgi:hypothetical protein